MAIWSSAIACTDNLVAAFQMLCVKTKDGKEQAVPLTQRRFRNQMQSANDCERPLLLAV